MHRSHLARIVTAIALLVLGPKAVMCVADDGHVAIEVNGASCCVKSVVPTGDHLGAVDESCAGGCADSAIAFVADARRMSASALQSTPAAAALAVTAPTSPIAAHWLAGRRRAPHFASTPREQRTTIHRC